MSFQGTALPLTKQKKVRCFKQNLKKNDDKNYEIEKMTQNEDIIETLQQRHSRDTKCVVVTSVTDDDHSPRAKLEDFGVNGPSTEADIDMPQSHDANSPFGGGLPSGGDIDLGRGFDSSHLDTDFGSMHEPNYPKLEIPSIPSVGSNFGDVHDPPNLKIPGEIPSFGNSGSDASGKSGGIDDGFGNLQDLNTFRSGSTGDNGGGALEEENVKTYEFATNIKRQETYDHHGFHQERSRVAAPGSGWKTTYRHDGPGSSIYETSANDLDHKISSINGVQRSGYVDHVAALICLVLLPLTVTCFIN